METVTIKCEICGRELANKQSFKVHMINEHKKWEQYDSDILSSFGVADQQTRVKLIAEYATGKVLDVGGGDGNIAKAMQDKGCDVIFTDISADRVANTKKRYGLKGVIADACKLPFPDRSFDTVVCAEVLEHIRPMGEALSEAIRVAKKKIIMSYPISSLWDMDETHQWQMRVTAIDRDGSHRKLHDGKGSFIVMTMNRINGNE